MTAAGLSLGRVLCALDVEAGSRGPLAMASVLAEYFTASLDGLHAVAPAADWGNRVEKVRRLIAEHSAREQLESLLAPFAGKVDVESFIARGQANEVILNHAAQHSADLIVLGGANEPRADGNAQRVIPSVAARANCAVMSVPGESSACAMRRILLPVTAATAALTAAVWATTLAKRFEASVGVVRVKPVIRGFWSSLLGSNDQGQSPRDAGLQDAVERVLQTLRAAELVAVHEHPALDAQQVVELAVADGYDLVVVGLARSDPGGRGAELLGRLRRDCQVPTLSIRAPACGLSAQTRHRQDAASSYPDLRASA